MLFLVNLCFTGNFFHQALKDSLKLHCHCHGTSGSCVSRTCWQDLPGFKKIGSQLKQRYLKASRVKTIKYPSPNGRRDAYLWLEFGDNKPPSRDLVYIEDSPNYCDRDRRRKIPGTTERECNKTSDGIDGCELMCCGRGYNTHEIVKKWRCNCKFHWCCHVECENCKERVEIFRCK